MIYQTDAPMGRYFNKYGCLFSSIAFARPHLGGKDWTHAELRDKWEVAIIKGMISGDLNMDGDMDDGGELEIQDHNSVCKLLEVPLSVIPGHHNPATKITEDLYAIGAFFNPRTKFTHFAVVDKDLKVIYDPIRGGSVTCREGYVRSLRLYSIHRG